MVWRTWVIQLLSRQGGTKLAPKFLYASMAPPTERGALIVLEGCDRSGKTTQCNLLKENLIKQEMDVKLLKFPGKKKKR